MTLLYNHPLATTIAISLISYAVAGVILTGCFGKRARPARPDGEAKP